MSEDTDKIEEERDEIIRTKQVTVSMGPQHPSAHGVLHLILDMQGERILRAECDIGYLHRGTEKIAENLRYSQFTPYTDRLDYMSAASNNLAYVGAVEKILGIEGEIPERAEYLRVISSEIARCASHLLGIGAWAVDMGALSVFLYCIREREMCLDLFEQLCGSRMTCTYLRVGGVRYDADRDFLDNVLKFVRILPTKLDEYEQLLTGNRVWIARNRDIGAISGEEAINFGLSGPNLRASGIPFDLRKDRPYSVYDRFDFDVPVGEKGDCFDRYLVRLAEMRQSLRIIEQAVNSIPDGPVHIDNPEIFTPHAKRLFERLVTAVCNIIVDLIRIGVIYIF